MLLRRGGGFTGAECGENLRRGVFELNVENYPESANVYDSLAEAFTTNGDRKRAIENYQRSLDLDPGNTNAVQKLRELRETEE